MSYLLAQIFVCLLAAGALGVFIGWWFRGGCKKKLHRVENEWSAKYDTDRAIWQGKIDAAEGHIQRSLHKNNSEWDVRLRDAESTWEGKVQGLVGNYDAEITNLNRDRENLEDDLLAARSEARRAKEELQKIDNQWNLKLKDIESTWEGKVQGIKGDYEAKVGNNDHALQALKDELAQTKKALVESEKKVEDIASSYEDKINIIKDNYESKTDSSDDELQALRAELASTQSELTATHDEWSLKLKDVESTWEGKVQGIKSNYASISDDEVKALRQELEKAKSDAKEANLKLTQSNNEWNFKLKDIESTWQGKVESVKSDFTAKTVSNESELQSLKSKLENAENKLAKVEDEWSLKLKDVESTWQGKVEAVKSDTEKKAENNNGELEALKAKLADTEAQANEAKAELARANDQWSLKLKDVESTWQGKVEAVKSDTEKKAENNNGELEALKAKLADTEAQANEAKAELARANDQWSLKLKDTESTWQGKVEAVKSEYDSKAGGNDEELQALKIMLEKTEAEAKDNKSKLAKIEDEWRLKLKNTESSWEGKVQSVKSEYDAKKGSSESELKTLKAELDKTKSQLQSSDSTWQSKLKDIEAKAESSDKKLKTLEADLEGAKKEVQKAKSELASSNDEWSKKLKSVDSSWEGKVQGIMSDYDGKISAADKEKASLKANLNSVKAEVDAAKDEMLKSDGELFGALGHIEESYEVEALEGIGAGYGKKFRALGVTTTDEFASKFLENDKAAVKAAKETGIDKDAILAWGSMADLISLPGINPDDAELLQAVGIKSKDDLTKQDAKSLHDKMVAYNSKHKIAPDVPSTALLLKLTKLPDNKAIAKAVKATKGEGEHTRDSYDIEEIEGIGPSYGKKFRSFGVSTTSEFADKFLNDDDAINKASKDTGITFNAIKAWSSMADLMRLPGIDGQYAEIMQAVGVSSKDELKKFDATLLHEKMLKYNKTNPIVPEVPSIELLSRWATSQGNTSDNTKDTKGSQDSATSSNKTASTGTHLNECYEIEEVEGIGPGYGKRFRNLGINTTCDLAQNYLRDNKAIKKTSKKMGVDFDAIKAWASMADLMRLPGVDGQYAEIMQTVGLDSRKELTHISLNHLHELMVEFNAKNPIVPEVPTMDMLVAWSTAAKKQK